MIPPFVKILEIEKAPRYKNEALILAIYFEMLTNPILPSISMIFSLLHDLAWLLIQDKISETLVVMRVF